MSSHALKYYVEHISDVDGNERTYRIELLEDGFGGSATEKKGWADTGVFRLNFERLSREQLFEGIAQKGRLELDLAIQNASDLSILTDIVSGDEDKYKLRLKVDGSVKWTGFVIPDLIQYREGDYPHPGTITAKDLSLIEAEDFETNTAISYELYMSVIAGLVNSTGLDLNVHSYNDWTTPQISDTDDYFNQAYIDKYQLQNFSSFNEGNFEARNKLDVLKEIIPPGYILRQYDNVWNLFSVDYLAKSGGTVDRYEYDTAGTKTGSTSSIDLTEDVDRIDNYIEGTSQNKPWRGLKQLRVEFNHKTSIQNLLFRDEYVITDSGGSTDGDYDNEEEIKVSDTTNRIVEISGQVEVTTDTNPGSDRTGEAEILIQVGDEELSLSDGSWDENNGAATVSVIGSDTTLNGSFGRRSNTIPIDIGEDTLRVVLRWATVSGETVQQVRWHNLSCRIINGDDVDNGASKFFRLTQSGTYSSKKDITPIIFGQGPDDESNSALRYFSGSAVFEMLTGFRHVGDGSGSQYEEFILTNLMNLQRGVISSLNADLRALYNPRNLLVHNSKNYLFLDGQLSGKDSLWNGTIVELNWQTGSDTFSEFFKLGSGDSGNTIAVSSGTGASQGDFDARYLQRDKNLSDLASASTARSNLGLANASADLDLNSISVNGTNLFPSDDPQPLGTSDSPTFAGATIENDGFPHITMDRTALSGVNKVWDVGPSVSSGEQRCLFRYRNPDGTGIVIYHQMYENRLQLGASGLNGSAYFQDESNWVGDAPSGFGKVEAHNGAIYLQGSGVSSTIVRMRTNEGSNVVEVEDTGDIHANNFILT